EPSQARSRKCETPKEFIISPPIVFRDNLPVVNLIENPSKGRDQDSIIRADHERKPGRRTSLNAAEDLLQVARQADTLLRGDLVLLDAQADFIRWLDDALGLEGPFVHIEVQKERRVLAGSAERLLQLLE